jgi:2-polyprenyl-6-methoxyphenol hydroxylase-like FAD-dependent oxidoreductase
MTKVLYNKLGREAQSKLFPNKKLQNITSLTDGVQVTCADGSSYSGSIVIGADGAHSLVRSLMRSLALEHGSADVNAENPFLTTYRALWVRFPTDSRLKPGMTCETHGYQAATQFFVGTDNAVCGMYEQLKEPTRERQRYTIADQAAVVKRWENLPLIPNGFLTLGEAYQSRLEAGLVSLEEGVVDHWSWAGRIVLAGDAAHKFTPSTGAGCNTGMIDVLALVSELHSALEKAREVKGGLPVNPSREDLETVFQTYQEKRMQTVQDACSRSGQATAAATWATAVHKFMDQHIISHHTVQRLIAAQSSRKMPSAPMFDFLHRRETVDVCS